MKRVDLEKGLVVLDSGRVIAVRLIQRDGKRVELEAIKPNDDVFVSGNDLGFSTELVSRRAR